MGTGLASSCVVAVAVAGSDTQSNGKEAAKSAIRARGFLNFSKF